MVAGVYPRRHNGLAESSPGVFEQLLHVTAGDSKMLSDSADAKLRICQIFRNDLLGRCKPRLSDPTLA